MPRKLPPILSPDWLLVRFALAPESEDCRRWLSDLHGYAGSWQGVALLLGCPLRSVMRWGTTRHAPEMGTRRAIWLTWAIILHPERCQTQFDLITWGRFAVAVERGQDGPDTTTGSVPPTKYKVT